MKKNWKQRALKHLINFLIFVIIITLIFVIIGKIYPQSITLLEALAGFLGIGWYFWEFSREEFYKFFRGGYIIDFFKDMDLNGKK